MFITTTGKILPCERISHEYAMGYVREGKVVIEIDKVIEKYNQWYKKYIPQCTKCYHNHTCKECMFYNRNLNSYARCESFMDEEEFHQYLDYQHYYLEKHPKLYKK